MPRPTRTSLIAAAALGLLGLVNSASADVATVFSDLRAGVDQRIGQYEADPAQKKVVKILRGVSASLAATKGRLAKDAKTLTLAVRNLETVAPGDQVLSGPVQRGIDEFLQAAVSEQQALDALVRTLPEGAKRRRAEKAAAKVAEIFAGFDAAPTQSARMDVLRRTASAADQGFKVAGATKGFFVTALVDDAPFMSLAPTASVGDSGDALAPVALAVSATAGSTSRAHRVVEIEVDLPFFGPGAALLGMQNAARFSSCPGGGGACSVRTTGAMSPGTVQITRMDDGYGIASGSFEFAADDGLGGTTIVNGGAFRVKYR